MKHKKKIIGFHASHELYSPKRLLNAVKLAEQSGFEAASCSDHFRPWKPSGQSGYAFSWLAAALQATNLTFGSVHAPGQRYHPAISAQAIATLAEMFPERYWVALGSGEALNESVTGDEWTDKETRDQRFFESVQVIKRLLAGEKVSESGLIKVKDAFLYTRPSVVPEIFGAAIGEKKAHSIGEWADGMITVGKKAVEIQKKIKAFHEGGGKDKPVYLQVALSHGPSDEEAAKAALRNWPLIDATSQQLEDIDSPEKMEALSDKENWQKTIETFNISSSFSKHTEWIEEYFSVGVDGVYIHYLGDNLEEFIKQFGEKVISKVKRSY